MKKILVTGGCGFIGSHIVEKLLENGWETLILDNLSPQVHSSGLIIPRKILDNCQLIQDDIRNIRSWKRELKNVKVIIHLASETGVGQSMYEIERYSSVNVTGTGIMLEQLFSCAKNVEKIILSSSRAVYGEGDSSCRKCGVVRPKNRSIDDLKLRKWEVVCPFCNGKLDPIPTSETSPKNPISIYGITKLTQEQLVYTVCKTLGIQSVILRYQNVYGPRQSLTNPYTGILSIFSTRIRNNLPLEIYEDGLMTRDFIHVYDVVDATLLALYADDSHENIYNVGSGAKTTVIDIAKALQNTFNIKVPLKFNNYYRMGDIRHCFSDNSNIKHLLGFVPKVHLTDGLKSLTEWVSGQSKKDDVSENAFQELLKNKIYR